MNEKIKSPSGQGAGGGSGGAGAGGGSGSGGTTGVATGGNIGPPSMPPSPAANTGGGPGGGGPPPPQPPNTGSESQVPPHHYGPPVGGDPSLSHYHPMHQQPPHGGQHLPPHQQQPGGLPPAQAQNPGEHPNKDEYSGGPMGVSGPPPPPPGGHHPVYGRYHHGDPGMDPYRPYAHAMQQPAPGGKPQQQTPPPAGPGGIASPSRPPPQRYIPGQPPQGPTPTLNSLLQSSHPPPPPQHRYSSNYDPQQQQQQQQQQGVPNAPQQTQGPGAGPPPGPHGPPPPPPPHQSPYGTQQGWAPPPRPYSPQMGPSQVYRTPPPQTSSRGQPPYPQQTAPHGQNSGSYPSSPQQQQQLGAGGPPPPLSAPPPSATNQNATGSGPTSGAPPPPNSQYAPYPQRYPTPPGPPPGSGVAPNHRTPYSAHQYPDPNRPWPSGGTSPAPSPGPHQSGGHPPLPPHPPASPHQSHPGHHGPPGGVPGNVAQPPPPSSTSPGHAPSPSPQPSQASPSPHQELIGQNSNDSSSGGAHSGMGSGPPGTPNPQQMMRPTPSPTGSSGSRSMSPAVAQNHPISRPSSNQSSSGGPMQQPGPPTQQSQQCPSSGGGQQQAPPNQTVNSMPTPPPPGAPGAYPPPPHMHGAYKMPGGQSPLPAGYGPPPQQQQYQQGQYPPRPQYAQGGYAPAPPPNQQPPANNMLPGAGQQYAGRPLPNHTGNNPHAQYPPYQNWVPPAPQTAPAGAVGAAGGAGNTAMGNHVQGKATPPPGGAPPPQGSASPRPLNYLKQHLQHKGGYTGSGSMPPQGYGNGPAGMHPGMPMGPPPHHMGPPHGPTSMGPPASTPPQSMMSGPVGGPSGIEAAAGSGIPEHISQDNGISSSGSSSTSAPHAVTSVVTTGPDGAPMDEVSQQSTLSNASAASAEDPQCTTPKRKNDPYSQSHLAPPSTSPSGHAPPTGPHPGGAGEEYDMNSPPNWTRTPASPQVFNSHVANQDSFRSNKKSDSLCKLYEMDDSPDRRVWLDKLRTFMEDRRTPITACPTISKQPLDLYRLYIYVKDRGGFVEVTKSKTWKDIAGLLGIGASSSAAYTLRKHYTKNLLAFECHFDRGDCDPGPIIQQAEAGTKKKTTKAASVPSPGGGMVDGAPPTAGSSNSQDSFPVPPGQTANPAIDGYPGYPGSAAYPGAGPQPEYAAPGQIQRPPSQSNAQTPHAGPPYPGQPGAYGQYGSADQYNASGPPGQFGQNQAQFPIQNRSMYPPYGAEGEAPPPGSNQYGPYGNRPYSQPPPGGAQTPAPPGGPTAAGPPAGGPNAPGGAYPSGAPTPQDYYRPPDQSPQPRRHPDFVKDTQSTYGYNTRPQLYGGWQAGSQPYRSQYPPSPAPQGWGGAPPRTAAPPGAALGPPNQQAPPSAQWELRYPPQQGPPPPPQQQQPYQQTQPQGQPPPPPPQWGQMGACGQPPQPGSPGSPLRPPNNQQQQRLPNTVGPPGMAGPQQPPGMPGQPGAPPPGSLNKSSYAMPPPQSLGNSGGPPCGPPGSQLGPPPGMSVGGMPKPPSQMMSQQQMPQQLHQHQQAYVQQQGGQLVKKELIFPADSVEATTPVMYRRKRLTKADVCPVDPWRIFMAMRSGLLAECTWALDVLNVLLFDDTTVQYFGLAHLPGLLTLLLEHFQKHLAEMFSDNDTHTQSHRLCAVDMKNGEKHTRMRSYCSYNRKRQLQQQEQKNNKLLNGDKNDDDASVKSEEKIVEEELDLGQIRDIPKAEERVLLLSHTPNFTMVSRKGLSVRLQAATEDIFVIDNQKNWDVENTRAYEEQVLPSGASTWTFGFGSERDPNDGIIDVFKSEFIDIPFARFIRSNKNKHKMNNINNNNNNNNTSNNNKNNKSKDVEIKVEPMESGTSVSDSTDEDTRLSFGGSKKRRIYNNSNNNNNNTAKSINADGVLTKKSKLQNEEEGVFVQPSEIKKEVIEKTASTNATTANDSDCREVDMEIERSNDKPQDDTTTTTTPATEDETEKETVFDPIKTIRDPALILQRRRDSSYEDECYTRDEASLYLVNESQDALARRCINISNIFRNLSFVPGNEIILARSARFLAILGRLLLLNHEHLQRTPKTRNYDREEDTDFSDSCSSLQGEREWWWEYLIHIRENMLVALTNIAGHLELSRYEEIVARPLIDGLLHWAVCPSAHGQDPFPSCGPNSLLSPQRLALEALCKLCVTDANVDLVIATPPFARLEKLCAVLTRHLCRNEDQVLREFSVNLLHYLAAADSAMARTVALQSPCISYLVAFIEQAESTALGVANQHGINYLRENPDAMGTSLDMLRRAAGTLLHLARHADNRSLFMQQEQRLLGLVMSHILDQQVALIISRVLFQVSRGAAPLPSLEYRNQQRQQNDTHDKKSPANTQAVASNVEEKTVKTDKNAKELKTEKTQEGDNAKNAEKRSSTETAAAVNSTEEHEKSNSNLVDENSNSSNQLPPNAILNDVSNSSTNSNSCSTAASVLSNNSSSLGAHLNNNVAGNASATTGAASAVAATDIQMTEQITPQQQQQQQPQQQQQQQQIPQCKSILGGNNTTVPVVNCNSNSNSSSNCNNNNNNNISLNNGNSRSSNSSNSSSGSGSGTNSITNTAAAQAAAAAAAVAAAASASAQPSTAAPTAAASNTTAAVA